MKGAMRVVIIGNGPAAVAAAETARDLDAACEITVISKERVPFYTPCALADYVEGSVARKALFLRDEEFYRERKIRTLFGLPAVGLDNGSRRVRLLGGEMVAYDRLLVACGARAVLPPIAGLTSTPGSFALKTLADADGILGHLGLARRAVVIGSGLVGLEATQALLRRGLQVTLLEALPQVLPQMLDAEMASLVERRLRGRGAEVLVDCPAEAVLGGANGVAAVRAGGRQIPCELVVCAAGVRPDLSAVAGSGIETSEGILVDDRMETSVPGVFAAGDVVEGLDQGGRRRVLANWPNAVNGGRVAGSNLVGVERRFAGPESVNVVRVFDLPVSSFGDRGGDRFLRRQEGGVVWKLGLRGGRIVGGQSFGEVDRAGLYHELMKTGRDVAAFGEQLLDPGFGYARLLAPRRAPGLARPGAAA